MVPSSLLKLSSMLNRNGERSDLKLLANEDTLLRTHCCRHKCFPVCPRAQHLLRTQILCPGDNGSQKMFLILFRNTLCPQQMFPSLRSPRNIMSNNVSSFASALSRMFLLINSAFLITTDYGDSKKYIPISLRLYTPDSSSMYLSVRQC